jgi:hypothetical protein
MILTRTTFALALCGMLAGIAVYKIMAPPTEAASSSTATTLPLSILRNNTATPATERQTTAEGREAILSDEEQFNKELLPNFPDFRLRPFPVVKSSATHEWTAEDGRTDAAIRALAHNALEEENLKRANAWTKRRQLVYRKETLAQILPDLQNGTRKQITVPGFDGKEYVVDVQKVRVFSVGTFGVSGTLQGSDIPFVLGSTSDGRESMRYLSPDGDGTFLFEPREGGQGTITLVDEAAQEQHADPLSPPIRNDDVGTP